MPHGLGKREVTPLTEDDVQGALHVFQSLGKLVGKPGPHGELVPSKARTVDLAKHIHASRAGRANVFGPDLFAEPAWDILLSLYVADQECYRMTVSAACNESGVSHTTALRWMGRLIELQLIRRRRNPWDSRSNFVELSPEGLQKMDQVLQKLWVEHFPID